MKQRVQPELKVRRQGDTHKLPLQKRIFRWFKDRVEFGAYRTATNRLTDHLVNSKSDNIIKLMKEVSYYLRGSERVSLYINRKDNGSTKIDISPHLSVTKSNTELVVDAIPYMNDGIKRLIESAISESSVLLVEGSEVTAFTLGNGKRGISPIDSFKSEYTQTIAIPLICSDKTEVYGCILVEGSGIKLRGSLFERSLMDFVRVISKVTYGLIEATLDHMTGLTSKVKFEKGVKEAVAFYLKSGVNSTLTRYDVDDFKSFNETYGHAQGDTVLQHISRALLRSARAAKNSRDIIGRVGGDEMGTLLFTDVHNARTVATRTQKRIGEAGLTLLKNGTLVNVTPTTSVGICDMETAKKVLEFEGTEITPENLTRKVDQLADTAAKSVKQNGKNGVATAVFDEATSTVKYISLKEQTLGTETLVRGT